MLPPMEGDVMHDYTPHVHHAVETMDVDVKGKMKRKLARSLPVGANASLG